jgi:hypothetical protein
MRAVAGLGSDHVVVAFFVVALKIVVFTEASAQFTV